MQIVSLDNLGFWGVAWTLKLIPGKDTDKFIIELKNIVELKNNPKICVSVLWSRSSVDGVVTRVCWTKILV